MDKILKKQNIEITNATFRNSFQKALESEFGKKLSKDVMELIEEILNEDKQTILSEYSILKEGLTKLLGNEGAEKIFKKTEYWLKVDEKIEDTSIKENMEKNPIEQIDDASHILLFYEDEEDAKKIRIDFIKNGLKKQQDCFYITTKKDEKEFKDNLNELQNTEVNKKFHVFQINDPFLEEKEFGQRFEEIWNEIRKITTTPVRIACNVVGDISMMDNPKTLELTTTETCANEMFAKIQDQLLCTYFVGDSNNETRKKMLLEGLKNHQAVIFSTKQGTGTVFHT